MRANQWRAWLSVGCLFLGGLSMPSAQAADESSQSVRRLLGPLVLTQPLSPSTLARLNDEAESLYRFGLHRQSLEAFEAIIELVPDHAQAWLRIGNIQQRLGRRDRAMAAYRKAVASSPASGDEVRRKALFNLGVIHLDEVDKIITALEALSQAALARSPSDREHAVGPALAAYDAQEELRMLGRMQAARDDAADRMQATLPAPALPIGGGHASAPSMAAP